MCGKALSTALGAQRPDLLLVFMFILIDHLSLQQVAMTRAFLAGTPADAEVLAFEKASSAHCFTQHQHQGLFYKE